MRRVSWEHFSPPTSSLVRVLWAPCPSQAPTLGANWVFGVCELYGALDRAGAGRKKGEWQKFIFLPPS